MYTYIRVAGIAPAVGTSGRCNTYTAVSRARYNRAVNCIETLTFTFRILILYYPRMFLDYYL